MELPGGFFTTNHGCQSLYAGIENFIGTSNVIKSALITEVHRPRHTGPVHLSGTQNGAAFSATCDYVAIGVEQTLQNLQFVDLDLLEKSIFSNVITYSYFDGAVNLIGSLNTSTNTNFSLIHLDTTAPFDQVKNGWTSIHSVFNYSPANLYGHTEVAMSVDDFKTLVTQQLNKIDKSQVTDFSIVDINLHEYYPRPTKKALEEGNFWARLEDIQGRRKTFWVGTLQSGLNAHHGILDSTLRLMNENFPSSS